MVKIVALLFFFLLFSSSVFAVCDVSATNISFGNYDVFSASPNDSTGTITVTCTDGPPGFFVRISIGCSTNSGVFSPRQMKRGANTDLLNYNLFTTAARTTVWGDGTSGTSTVTTPQRVRRNRPAILTMYGRIPAGQNAFMGAYNDSLVITIDY